MFRSQQYRRAGWRAVMFFILLTGSHAAISTPPGDAADYREPPAPTRQVPLRFAAHNFSALCYNTQRCSVIYDDHDFTILDNDKPSPPPPSADYKEQWGTATYLGIRAFPPPVEVKWTAEDGTTEEAKVDFNAIFKDRLIWHNVPKADMKDFYSGPYAGDPDIFLEVNDHTVNVYMTMLVPTKTEQIPGNKYSNGRDDLFLAWSHTY